MTCFFACLASGPRWKAKVTEEEIKSIIQESAEGGEIQEIEQDIVQRVFALGDRRVSALMTHRSDLVWIDVNDSLEDIRTKMRRATLGISCGRW